MAESTRLVGTQEKHEKPQSESRSLWHHWKWEIVMFALGTAEFVAILIMFLEYRTWSRKIDVFQPRPDKPKTEDDILPSFEIPGFETIGFTTWIAVLAQFSQMALLVPTASCIGQLQWKWFQREKETADLDRFDQATRGPWGSLKLLFYFSWRQRLASLGAFTTILMLFFQPIVQQCFKPAVKEQHESNYKNTGMKRVVNLEENYGSTQHVVTETDLQDALRHALFGDQSNPPIYQSMSGTYASCYEYYCNWTSVSTLALCSSASDISDQITQENGYASLPALQALLPTDESPPSFQSGSTTYVNGQSAGNGTTGELPDLAEIYLLYEGCKDQGSDSTRWVALKGQLRFCVQQMDGRFNAGVGFQSLNFSEVTGLDWYTATKDGESAFCAQVGTEKEEFCVADAQMERLSSQIHTVFTTNATISDSNITDISYGTSWAQPLMTAIFGGHPTPPSCPQATARRGGFWNTPDYRPPIDTSTDTSRFDTLLYDVSQRLFELFWRNSPDVALGSAEWLENVISFNFYWFIFPSLVYALVAVFFVATMITTRNTPVWKSSPLPLLHATSGIVGVGCEDEIRKQAKKSKMRLSRAGKGWQLVENTP